MPVQVFKLNLNLRQYPSPKFQALETLGMEGLEASCIKSGWAVAHLRSNWPYLYAQFEMPVCIEES